MKRVLLYSPDVVGHPRVYCRVIADAIAGADCNVVIAMGFSEDASLEASPDLLPLLKRPEITMLDTRAWSGTGIRNLTAEEIVALQHRFEVDTTLFIEADKSNAEFARIAANEAPRLNGRNLGIFANTSEWYPGEDSFTGERKKLVAPTIRTTLGNVKRALLNRRDSARHFFERTIIGKHVLDEVLVKDERLAEWRGPPTIWMPEISRPSLAAETEAEAALYDRRRAELDDYLGTNKDREPVLYFGDAAFYKGYDLFLEFLSIVPGACGIHAGRTYSAQDRDSFRVDVGELRASLSGEGRLLETNEYVHTQRLKEMYFGCVRVYLTTHRLALSSSTIIQALELGKPVLVPDRGLLGHRVRENGLGDVYRYGDVADLKMKAVAMWGRDLRAESVAAARYWNRFSDTSIRTFFLSRLRVHPALDPAEEQ